MELQNKNTSLLKICIGDWHNASRDKRELSVVESLGIEVVVMAKGECRSKGESVDGFSVDRYSTRPLGKSVPNALNRVSSFFSWAHYARKYDADMISGHDFVALLIGKFANCCKHHKAKLIYDSHEFELGRNANRNKITRFIVSKLEKWAISSSEFTIVVNDSIADAVVKEYKLAERPVVVRNIPEYVELDQDRMNNAREDMLGNFDDPLSSIIMYHGRVTANRGLEKIIEIVSQLDRAGLYIIGAFDNMIYKDHLDQVICQNNAEKKVKILSAKPFDELIYYVAAADVGMIVIPPTCRSYYYMLPNKLFENIQAETPVITSDFPEIARIVSDYRIGEVVDATDTDQIKSCIVKVLRNSSTGLYKEDLKKAKKRLCWENEREILSDAYEELIK